jgi:hypothetical protein
MASNIVPGNIDGSFPIAGQDNSSQGFRDNFTAIKNNFEDAKTEIEDLQTNKASTSGNTSFNNYTVSEAVFKDTALTIYPHGTTSGDTTLDHANGHYHTLTTSGNVTLEFANWPGSGLGRIVLDITFADPVPDPAYLLTVTAATLVADNVTGFNNDSTNIITVTTAGRYLYEFVTPNAGTTVLMHQLGKLYT